METADLITRFGKSFQVKGLDKSLAGRNLTCPLEPSESIEVVKKNASNPEMVTFLNVPGDSLPAYGDVDLVFSIGVLHHIPDPDPVVKAAYNTLRPGGRLIVWLYGTEGNRLYLVLLRPIRALMRVLPSSGENALVWALQYPLRFLIYLGRRFHIRFPLRDYLVSVLGNLPPDKLRLVILDQLKPAYAKYYTGQESFDLLARAGFEVTIRHRRGYSWTVIGTKPM
mgnify:CR=1 FL=1